MDNYTVNINTYKGYLIITIKNILSPKISYAGEGIMFSGFNKYDLNISLDALNLLNNNLLNNHQKPALEIIARDKIWWASKQGIIIQPNELLNVFCIPHHTQSDNIVDEKIKNAIDNL